MNRCERQLRRVPVWFFSSGPLDDSTDREVVPSTTQVEILMERVGAQGHVTFGGRLLHDARGFPASAMAKKRAGDWRRPDKIRSWAIEIARALPTAHAGVVVPQQGRSLAWLVLHGAVGWALCAAVMGALLMATTLRTALIVHAVLAPAIFVVIARHYFQARGAREPISTALAFLGTVGVLDLVVVAGLVQRSLAMFGSIIGTWLPLGLIFVATLATGELLSTLPWKKPTERTDAHT